MYTDKELLAMWKAAKIAFEEEGSYNKFNNEGLCKFFRKKYKTRMEGLQEIMGINAPKRFIFKDGFINLSDYWWTTRSDNQRDFFMFRPNTIRVNHCNKVIALLEKRINQ